MYIHMPICRQIHMYILLMRAYLLHGVHDIAGSLSAGLPQSKLVSTLKSPLVGIGPKYQYEMLSTSERESQR